jgi:RNA polymerase sigma factor (sigma-70 family)
MGIEEFTADFFQLVKKMSREIIRDYSGWFNDPIEEMNDLVSVGMLELVNIFNRVNFNDPGYKSYVSARVRGSLLNYIYKNIPTVSLAGADCNKSETIAETRRFMHPVSLEDLVEIDCEPGDCPLTDELLFRHQVLTLISEFMANLDPKERFMLIARFHDGRTYEEIGLVVHMRRETVSEKINDLTARLGNFFRRKCSWRLEPADISAYLQETDLSMVILSEEEHLPTESRMERHK